MYEFNGISTRHSAASAPRKASFLGIPSELRFQIYDFVFALDLNCTILNSWHRTHSAEQGFKSVPDLNPAAKLTIPWLNLMHTCSTLAVELRALMSEHAFLENEQKTTYSLDLEATRGGRALGNTIWQRIPCRPDQVTTLEAYYNASRGFQGWGDGGPNAITSGLYQTPNHLIHCGPRFDSKRQLPNPMRLRELRIKIESRPDSNRQDGDDHVLTLSDRDTNPETTLYALGSIVGQIVRTGVLQGYVDNIRIFTDSKDLNWCPKEVEGTGIPEYWARYGFEWSMVLYQ